MAVGFAGLKVCNLHAFARGVMYACKNRREVKTAPFFQRNKKEEKHSPQRHILRRTLKD